MAASSSSTSSEVSVPVDLLFKYQRPQIEKLLLDWRKDLFPSLASEVTKYITGNENPFGAKEWRKYFGVDVGPEPELPKQFYQFWGGLDPIDPTKKVWETHLPPVLRPQFVTDILNHVSYCYSLGTLGQLVQNPQEGHPSQYEDVAEEYFRFAEAKAGPASWLVMRKDVFARGQSYAEQKQFIEDLNTRTRAGYENEPSAIDLATVIFTRHVVTGECHLGDNIGIENRWTYSRCRETVQYGNRIYHLAVGGFAPSGVFVYNLRSDYVFERIGVAALRKF